jgi:hypothetical protein
MGLFDEYLKALDNADEEDRCSVCGSLMVRDYVEEGGKEVIFLHCSNRECKEFSNKRKIHV